MSSQASFIQDGQQVLASDLNSLASSASISSGAALAALLGSSDANANDSPLTVVPGIGMTVVVGGIGQKVLVQSRLADYIPAQTYAIAAANSTDRIDLVAFRYADVIVSTGGAASFLDSQGNLGPQPTSYVYRGIQVAVVTGIPGAGVPAAPAGYDPLATIAVPAGATSIVNSNITMQVSAMALVAGGGSGGLAVYTPAGVAIGTTKHIVQGSLNFVIPINSANTHGSPNGDQIVTFTGAAAFTSASSYIIVCSFDITGLTIFNPTQTLAMATGCYTAAPSRISGSQFSMYLAYTPPAASTGSITVDWLAIGY